MKRYLVATYIGEYIRSHGYAPTYREISLAFGISQSNVPRIIQALARDGVIERQRYKTRGISIRKDAA